MNDSRLAGLYKLPVRERVDTLRRAGWLSPIDAEKLKAGEQVLSSDAADKIIENVVGVFGLPFAVAPNFLINDRDYMVPMAVEEPSIVAAVSGAARLIRRNGGFKANCPESLLAGQVHITGAVDPQRARQKLEAARQSLLDAANAVHPRLSARGGGVRDIEVRQLELPDGGPLIRVHLLVDTVDAMGANLVNSICEAIAPRLASLCEGEIALRILSNLVDRSVVTAEVCIAASDLAGDGRDGSAICDALVMANDIARVDPYRAATHNKGIMNGIDAMAIATGNDWRAIEAGAHAYAARSGSYQPLTRWTRGAEGGLVGALTVPLKVGCVGGTLEANPTAALGLAISGAGSASELALVMAAVGLAQNLAALHALVGGGIQKGHMKLHARSIAASVAAPDDHFDELVARLVDSGEIKRWKAEQILNELEESVASRGEPDGTAAGKVILFGEHAAVYGRHALALPLPKAVQARVRRSESSTTLAIPSWGLSGKVDLEDPQGADAVVALIRQELELTASHFSILVDSRLPRGAGLGSSAAIAVAVTRAMSKVMGIVVDDDRINAIAYECEKLAHGTPSGVDNTLSTFSEAMLFRNDGTLNIERLELTEVPPMIVACSNEIGLTNEQVAGVRERRAQATGHYDALFDEIDRISIAGAELLRHRNYEELGLAMNICHGLLNAIEVSTPELERMVALARQAGALGAKLTGAGGGGSIVALCPGSTDSVRDAMQHAGYRTLVLEG
ncbi:MAG: hydroxymethylglutaryl-CoA reductase, degradative [Woeseiaceae bacterium]